MLAQDAAMSLQSAV